MTMTAPVTTTVPLPVTDTRAGASFQVRVVPRASRTALAGLHGEGSAAALKIALHAPPVEGQANTALIEFLSDLLSVPRSAIEIAAGRHARTKTIVVRGKTVAELSAALAVATKKEPAYCVGMPLVAVSPRQGTGVPENARRPRVHHRQT